MNFLSISMTVLGTLLGGWGIYLWFVSRRYPGQISFVLENCIALFDTIVKNFPEISIHYQNSQVSEGLVLLKGYLLNTGSPHYVTFVKNVDDINIRAEGSAIRYDSDISTNGVNVNFVEIRKDYLYVRTYERGVEDETLACGTGVTASAIAYSFIKNINEVNIFTRGGNLKVNFKRDYNNVFHDIWLEGPVKFVFSGEIEV